MKITHIYHSGFCVELEKNVLIFDWYQGKLPDFEKDKNIYVFVSHKHQDHYGTCIWSLRKKYEHVRFIIDRGVRVGHEEDILFVQSNQKYLIDDLCITTFLSTDTGVAFLVEVEEKKFFHAGDLNAWCWEEDTIQNRKWQEGTYKAELRKLKDIKLDIAFLPLDPRLKNNAPLGILLFLKSISVNHIFPMHYLNNRKKMLFYIEYTKLSDFKYKIHTEDFYQTSK